MEEGVEAAGDTGVVSAEEVGGPEDEGEQKEDDYGGDGSDGADGSNGANRTNRSNRTNRGGGGGYYAL